MAWLCRHWGLCNCVVAAVQLCAVSSVALPTDVDVVSDWYKVLYGPSEQEELLDSLIKYALQPVVPAAEVLVATLTCISCIKNRGFLDEREARLVTVAPLDDEVMFRAGARSQIVPYVEVAAGPERQFVPYVFTLHANQTEGLPIEELRIGPSGEGSMVGARRLLDAFGYGETPIAFSEVSYRG